MEEIIDLSIKLHIFFVFAMIVVSGYIMYLFYADFEYVPLTRKVEFSTTIHYTVLAAIGFTGLIILTAQQFAFPLDVILMIVVFITLTVTSIKEFKLFKKTSVKNIQAQEDYRAFAKKKYLLDIILLVLVGLGSAVSFS